MKPVPDDRRHFVAGRADRPLAGIAFMAAGVFTIAAMDAAAKFALGLLPTFQLLGLHAALTFAGLLAFLAATGRLAELRTRRPFAHFARAAMPVVSMLCFFESLRFLPLATVIAIGFCTPLLMTAFSVPMLREHVGVHRWAAVGVGFAGVSVIVGPEAGDGLLSAGAVLALGAAVFYALGMTAVRWLAATESEASMVATQSLVQAFVGFAGVLLLPDAAVSVPGVAWVALAAMAVLLIAGQFLAFRAFRLAPVGAVAPFQYTELIWAALFGWVFWDELPPANVWTGAAIVVMAGLYVIWRERVRARMAR